MTGSIQEKINKDGSVSYRLFVSDGYGEGGKRQRYTRTVKAKNRKEAEKLLAQFVTEVEAGQLIDNKKITLQVFTDKWLTEYAEKNLAPKTISRYKQLLARINYVLGHRRLIDIRPLHIIEFCNNLTESGIRSDGQAGGLSPRTVLHHHRLLHSVLETAVKWQYLKENPARRVEAPKVPKAEARYFDENQTMILLEALEDAPLKYKTLIHLTLYGGLRAGEVLGIEWKDINFENRTIEIKRTSQYVDKKIITKTPKNESSCRLVTYPKNIMTMLKTYRVWWNAEKAKCGDKWHETDRLFVMWDGQPMHPLTPSKWYLQFIREYNNRITADERLSEDDKKRLTLPEVNFHGLRHTSATLLISQGHDIKTISARLGHSTASTTMNIYSHALRSADTAAADGLEAMLTRKKKANVTV